MSKPKQQKTHKSKRRTARKKEKPWEFIERLSNKVDKEVEGILSKATIDVSFLIRWHIKKYVTELCLLAFNTGLKQGAKQQPKTRKKRK